MLGNKVIVVHVTETKQLIPLDGVGVRRLSVRANADTPQDAKRAREFGAQGIGLCRTEHMFMGQDHDKFASLLDPTQIVLRRSLQVGSLI